VALVAPPRVDAYPFDVDRTWYNLDTLLVAYILWTAPKYRQYLDSLKESTARLEAARNHPEKVVDSVAVKIKQLLASDFYGTALVVNFIQIAALFLDRYKLNNEKLTVKSPTKKRVGRPKKNAEYY
jgi:hypothetical protein